MEYIVNSIFFLIVLCWMIVFIQSHRMFYQFRNKYTEIAKKEISHAFEPYAHPDKIIFFFKKKNQDILKKDKKIWALRKQTQGFLILSFGLIFCILIGFFLAILLG